MVDDHDSKSCVRKDVRVRVPPRPPVTYKLKKTLAYVVGVALGDGNLSNPNGRAIRLRVTCDSRYPGIQNEIQAALRTLLPKNRVATVPRKATFLDISAYSNHFADWMPWQVGKGSKLVQNARVPEWIFSQPVFVKECLRGLIQTDGSIYIDRGYKMINFTNACEPLVSDVISMVKMIGFRPTISKVNKELRTKYTVRIARDVDKFINTLNLKKT